MLGQKHKRTHMLRLKLRGLAKFRDTVNHGPDKEEVLNSVDSKTLEISRTLEIGRTLETSITMDHPDHLDHLDPVEAAEVAEVEEDHHSTVLDTKAAIGERPRLQR